jgi:hypothetical protein
MLIKALLLFIVELVSAACVVNGVMLCDCVQLRVGHNMRAMARMNGPLAGRHKQVGHVSITS